MESNITPSLKKTTNGLAIAGFVLSLIGLLLAFIPIINTISYILGTLALIFAIIGTVKSGKKALGIIAITLSVACFVAATAMKIAVAKAVVDNFGDSIVEASEKIDNIIDDYKEKTSDDDASITQNDEKNEDENTESKAETTTKASKNYEEIYNEYAQKIRDAAPTSSITELAEIANEGVSEMAKYMYKAKGTDGQYATYEEWASKLYDVYTSEAR